MARHMVTPIEGYDAGLTSYRARLTRHRPRYPPKLHPVSTPELFEVLVHLLRKY